MAMMMMANMTFTPLEDILCTSQTTVTGIIKCGLKSTNTEKRACQWSGVRLWPLVCRIDSEHQLIFHLVLYIPFQPPAQFVANHRVAFPASNGRMPEIQCAENTLLFSKSNLIGENPQHVCLDTGSCASEYWRYLFSYSRTLLGHFVPPPCSSL